MALSLPVADPTVQPTIKPPVVSSPEILDEIDRAHASLSPHAQDAISQAHGLIGLNAPETPEPPFEGIKAPPVSSLAPPPSPVAAPPAVPRGTMQTQTVTPHQSELARITAPPLSGPMAHTRADTGQSGIGQIHSPWARVPLQILDALGRGLAPGIEMGLPGTSGHHDVLVHQAGEAVKGDAAQQEAADKSAQEQALTGETGARTKEIEQQTQNLAQNLPKDAFELWFRQNPGKTMVDYEKDVAAGKQPSSAFDLWVKDNPGKSYADYQKDAAAAKTPGSAFELWLAQNPQGKYEDFEKTQQAITAKPITKEHAAELNANFDPIAEKYKLPKGQFREGMSAAESSQLMASLNDAIGKSQGAQHITIQQQAADRAAERDPATEREYMAVRSDLNKAFEGYQKQVDAVQQAKAELAGGAVGQAVGAIKTISALAAGQGSGVRITAAELDALIHARGIKGDFEGWLSGLEGKGKLPPEQIAQMGQVLSDVERKAAEKQHLYSDTLDKLGGAKDKNEIRKIESEFRKGLMAGGATASVYKEGNKTYNIPAGQEKDFENDHPRATKQ